MNTDIGTTFAAEAVDHLLTHGRQLNRKLADERHTQDHIARVKAEAERVTGATRWVRRMLPSLPDGNPAAGIIDGNPGVIFTWPGLTLGLVPGPSGMSSPFVYVLDGSSAGLILGRPQALKILPADASATWEERERNDLAAWIARQHAAGPRPVTTARTEPERRRITALELRLVDALCQYIREQCPDGGF